MKDKGIELILSSKVNFEKWPKSNFVGKLRKEVLCFLLICVGEVYVSFSNVVRPCVLGGCVKMWCRYCRVVCF